MTQDPTESAPVTQELDVAVDADLELDPLQHHLAELQRQLDRFVEHLNDANNNYIAELHHADGDRYNLLFGKKVQWLLSCPYLNENETIAVLNDILALFDTDLQRHTPFHIIKRKVNCDTVTLFLGETDEPVFAWDVYHRKVQVKIWDELINLKQLEQFVQQQLTDAAKELDKNSAALKNRNTLLDRGLYGAYFKNIVAHRKFKRDANILLSNNRQMVQLAQLTLTGIQTTITEKLKAEQHLLTGIDDLKHFTAAFPYDLKRINYQRHRITDQPQKYYELKDFLPQQL